VVGPAAVLCARKWQREDRRRPGKGVRGASLWAAPRTSLLLPVRTTTPCKSARGQHLAPRLAHSPHTPLQGQAAQHRAQAWPRRADVSTFVRHLLAPGTGASTRHTNTTTRYKYLPGLT